MRDLDASPNSHKWRRMRMAGQCWKGGRPLPHSLLLPHSIQSHHVPVVRFRNPEAAPLRPPAPLCTRSGRVCITNHHVERPPHTRRCSTAAVSGQDLHMSLALPATAPLLAVSPLDRWWPCSKNKRKSTASSAAATQGLGQKGSATRQGGGLGQASPPPWEPSRRMRSVRFLGISPPALLAQREDGGDGRLFWMGFWMGHVMGRRCRRCPTRSDACQSQDQGIDTFTSVVLPASPCLLLILASPIPSTHATHPLSSQVYKTCRQPCSSEVQKPIRWGFLGAEEG